MTLREIKLAIFSIKERRILLNPSIQNKNKADNSKEIECMKDTRNRKAAKRVAVNNINKLIEEDISNLKRHGLKIEEIASMLKEFRELQVKYHTKNNKRFIRFWIDRIMKLKEILKNISRKSIKKVTKEPKQLSLFDDNQDNSIDKINNICYNKNTK